MYKKLLLSFLALGLMNIYNTPQANPERLGRSSASASDDELRRAKGLTLFQLYGEQVYALNKKNALKKFKKLGMTILSEDDIFKVTN